MKKAIALIALLSGSAFAQVQLGRNVQLGAGGTGPTLDVQTNGVDNLSQTLLDLDQGSNMVITNTSSGHVRFDATTGIVPQVIPPISGQYVVIPASTGTLTNDEAPGRSTINSTSGNFVWTCSGIFCTIAPLTTANWSGFALPSYVNPANVTAIYADVITSAQSVLGRMPFSGANGTSMYCGAPGSPQLLPSSVASPWLAVESTKLLSIAASSISSLTCPITLGASGSGDSGEIINVSAVRLIVYYTGTAPPADTRVQVVPPLTFNANLNQLVMDPLGVGFLQPLTVLTLPAAASSSGKIFQVTDGTSSSDCTTGGGSTVNLCRSNGTTWSVFSNTGSVSSVANSDGTLTISPTTGSVVGSLNLAHANTWTAPISVADGTGQGGTFNALEGTVGTLTPTAAHDIFYADATAHCIQYSANGGAFACLGSGGSSAFSALTSSTNTTAAMLVGSGASLAPTGTGTIQATNIASTVAVSSPITVTGSGTTASPYTIACPTCGTGSGGTSVSQNSGTAETNLPITGYMPQVCSDTSASGTAQTCTVANSFTPQAGNCIVYKTTTANSGTGLTVNVDSLGAKSVAVPGASGWTTTLVASSSIPANKPMNLCYDGTNWNASGTGFAASGYSPTAPVVRSSNIQASNAASYTVTWPTGTVAGDTVFIFYGGGNQISSLPSGWTQLDPLLSNPQWTGEVIYKVMTSGDISTGNVVLTPTSAFDAVVGAATVIGSVIAFRDFASQKNSTGGTTWTVTTRPTPVATDLAIYFGSSRANATATISLGTLLQQANDGSAGCGAIYAGSPASFGPLMPAFNYTAAGTGSYNVAVVLRSAP